ncbi:MAG: terminase large subunit, partial [Lachnospiraceae bacterium]|nr:terminase large subunit [Lachnospiraceae bacterium]
MADRVTEFARKNLKNKKDFGEDARLAFKRHLDDLKRSKKKKSDFPYVFDAEKSIELANKLTIAEGEGADPYTCAGFQELRLGSLFGWVHRETGKRRFTDSYVQLGRQQGKSVLNAILGIKCSNFDHYNYGQIYCTATKSDQARIVLNEISKFINADADLQELFDIKDYKSEITGKITNTVIRALGRDTKSIDGFRPYLGIVDEYHAHKDNQMYKLLKGGTRKLKQSLVSNPDNWIKCCPLTGKDKELLAPMIEDAKKAQSMGGAEMRDFLTKTLNIWVTNAETAFIDLAEWEKCASGRSLEDFAGKQAVIGLDLSSGGDLTSYCLEFPYEDETTGDRRYFLHSHSFIPKNRMQEHMDLEDNAPYV